MALPFASDTFAAVTCLEALEFFPDPKGGVSEMVRVLATPSADRPYQGWLVTSNRIGWEARLMPGKAWPRDHVASILKRLPLSEVEVDIWQDIYDLVWARKADSGK